MSERAITNSIELPEPRIAIGMRAGTMDDIPFLDSLQKAHTKQVGWMPTAQFEGKIRLGHVLIAEERDEVREDPGSAHSVCASLRLSVSKPVGYIIGNDQYFKRDDLGIIYQLNVVPDYRRSLVGAMLLKAMFDRSAWGCKLYCCWCAQDIEANRFWEAMGFVPLAFRTGSRTKGKNGTPRVHIFWQKRIREGDTTTPWWFPSQTSGGSIREDRLVLPIPPGTHWSEAKPVVLPGAERQLEAPTPKRIAGPKVEKKTSKTGNKAIGLGFRRFADPLPPKAEKPTLIPRKKTKVKNDPKYIAAARELRDRWLEEINSTGNLLPTGKYSIARALPNRAPDGSSDRAAERALPDAA